MIVSHEHQFIFIGIPRTGTVTVRNILDPYTPHTLHPQKQNYTLPMGDERRVDHATAIELRAHLSQEIWGRYFKFSVVRNPWDRVVSWFNSMYFKRQGAIFDDWLRSGGLDQPDYEFNHMAPAVHWLLDQEGKIAVDYIIRFECYAQGLEHVLKRINLDVKQIPRLNVAKRLHYRDLYTSETRDIVANYYAEDIERFNYNF